MNDTRFTTVSEALDAYNDDLDAWGPVSVAGLDFAPSRVLRKVDPIAYRCGFNDWLDAEGVDDDALTGWDLVTL